MLLCVDFCFFPCACLYKGVHVLEWLDVHLFTVCAQSCVVSVLSGELSHAGPNFRLLMCDVFGALAALEV